ncbi:hypothetical protein BDY17DRAFT_229577, partial [Neohortaea acidophila]
TLDPFTLLQTYDSDLNPSRPVKSSPLASSTIAGLPLELLDRLKAFPLFRSAPESFLLSIGRSLRPNVYVSSQEIIREGEDAKAMYWLVRGAVRVTSRDGESTYAELKPGAFFGEIGILMDVPRTASVVAAVKSMVVRLNKEDLQKELPLYPEVERAIREEAVERLTILERKKQERRTLVVKADGHMQPPAAPRKRSRDWMAGDVEMGDVGALIDGEVVSNKRRKSPSPGLAEIAAGGAALDNTPLTIRELLKELPLFSGLPSEILHFLGLNAHPKSFAPFTEILKEGSMGRDVYFIIKGVVEVVKAAPEGRRSSASLHTKADPVRQEVKARLKTGQYFGEVTSLSLAPRRTATVRSVSEVECLTISGEVLDQLWKMCDGNVRRQIEHEAKRRLEEAKKDADVQMKDVEAIGGPAPIPVKQVQADGAQDEQNDWRAELPTVVFDEPPLDIAAGHSPQIEPIDPDPFFNPDLDNIRAKSRRSSLAPPLPGPDGQTSPLFAVEQRTPSPPAIRLLNSSPLRPRDAPARTASPSSPAIVSPAVSRRPSLARPPSTLAEKRLPESILALVFQHLDLLDLMRLRLVSRHWWQFLNTSPDILHHLNLSQYNRYVTDEVLRDIIVPFAGSRPKEIDLSNCFHVTDEGFRSLTDACGEGAKVWKMKSVWDVQGPAVLALVEKAKGLEEIDLSNCRKVGDNLLARVVGWIVPNDLGGGALHPQQPPPPPHSRRAGNRHRQQQQLPLTATQANQPPPPPGTVIGASNLKRLTLSYCKHIQDRSMAHIAVHASERLESLDLTRCTSISDAGFHSWSIYDFKNLRKLVLADCTYLTDQAIVGVVGGCRSLRELDLSFCCALSDTATEVLALGLPALRSLNMAFCGSAVSDNSLRCIGLHLLELRYLCVRGCVRVTGQGVDSVVEGCRHLEELDVSQCKNLRPWLDRGGVQKVNGVWKRKVVFSTVADGTWR